MKYKSDLTIIHNKLDTFTFDQLTTLFHIIFKLNCLCDYFMSEETHQHFILDYYSIPDIRTLESFRYFMIYSVIKYVSPFKFHDILRTIVLIENETPSDQIINTLNPSC